MLKKKIMQSLVYLWMISCCLTIFTTNVEMKSYHFSQLPRMGVDYSRFDHATHSLNCKECHVIEEGKRVTQYPGRLSGRRESHAACIECHNTFPFTINRQAKSFCVICHEREGSKALKKFPDQRDDQFGIKFSHKRHVGLDVKGYGGENVNILDERSKKGLQGQDLSIKFGCSACHVKDGSEKKEENFSSPHHPECAVCHGLPSKSPKKVLPHMYDCLGCHSPWMAIRPPVQNLVLNFRHDKDHEIDTRDVDEKGKEIEKVTNKDGKEERPKLDCKFCHKETKSGRLLDIKMPPLSSCTACHSKKGGAHVLTPAEAINLSEK